MEKKIKKCKDCVCFRPSQSVDHAHCIDTKFYSPRDILPNNGNIEGCRNWRKDNKSSEKDGR